jgi:hypothetical protein
LQAIQAREFDTNQKTAFAAVISVFQDLGYIVLSADWEAGFVTSKSPTQGSRGFANLVKRYTRATAHIEELRPGSTRIRLNFVETEETSSSYGAAGGHDDPILDPIVYQNAFTKIQEAIFHRGGSREEPLLLPEPLGRYANAIFGP